MNFLLSLKILIGLIIYVCACVYVCVYMAEASALNAIEQFIEIILMRSNCKLVCGN